MAAQTENATTRLCDRGAAKHRSTENTASPPVCISGVCETRNAVSLFHPIFPGNLLHRICMPSIPAKFRGISLPVLSDERLFTQENILHMAHFHSGELSVPWIYHDT